MSTRTPRSGGFTLLEIMIALSVMVIAIVGLVSVITYTTTANQVNRENTLAMRAAEAKVEEMRQWDVSTIFVRYSIDASKPADLTALALQFPLSQQQLDPSGAPTTAHYPGPSFAKQLADDPTFMPIVGPKDPLTGLPLNMTATVSFPVDAGSPFVLRETAADADAIAEDLNLNGVVGDVVTLDYRVLPATITITWRGIKGLRTLNYRYLFLKKT